MTSGSYFDILSSSRHNLFINLTVFYKVGQGPLSKISRTEQKKLYFVFVKVLHFGSYI